ncbi:MAG TPA: hypothetical protein VEC99_09930 [Clostridia bacterium]|nr:hypothetical protein [Clostridia bacterium]
MNAKPNSFTLLQKVCRVACVVCLLLLAVYCGNTFKALLEHGWTLPWWNWHEAPTQELQSKFLVFERFTYWQGAVRQCLCYGLFAALFWVFGKGRVFARESVLLVLCLALVFFMNSLLNVAGPTVFRLPTNLSTQFLREIDGLLVSSVALIAAWVMREGTRIQEEQALTI